MKQQVSVKEREVSDSLQPEEVLHSQSMTPHSSAETVTMRGHFFCDKIDDTTLRAPLELW